jgi:XTP/dITP diphosphohydrolase
MPKLVLATANTHKVNEFQRIFAKLIPEIEIVPASSFSQIPEVKETGSTFSENALLKAQEIANFVGQISIADDSGLVVEALNGAPGIYSARYAGEFATDSDNVTKILEEIKDIAEDKLAAKFVCAVAYFDPKTKTKFVLEEHMKGYLVKSPRGGNGFGYDPIFVPTDFEKTFAELSDLEKDQISHRGLALAKLATFLKK